MSKNLEFENLVDVIAARVRERLGSSISHDSHGDEGCEGCGSCGITPRYQPDPAVVGPQRTDLSPKELAGIIDHTYLKPDATREEIETLCKEARQYGFFSVCVNSTMVHLAKSMLQGSSVKVCAVVGFPLGAQTSGSKAYEAREAVRCGADEIDMVINVGALKSLDYALVEADINRVVKAVQPRIVKVILETGSLCNTEKIIACALSKAAGAHFVKTSTGFGPGGATVDDIKLMRRVVGPEIGVKASGGVRDAKTALAMVQAGASRLGLSSSIAVVTGKKGSGYY